MSFFIQKPTYFKLSYHSDNGFVSAELKHQDITSFGLQNRIVRKKGEFSRFVKEGFVISNGRKYLCNAFRIAELKTHFKKNFKTTKVEVFSIKKEKVMRGINWTYRVR